MTSLSSRASAFSFRTSPSAFATAMPFCGLFGAVVEIDRSAARSLFVVMLHLEPLLVVDVGTLLYLDISKVKIYRDCSVVGCPAAELACPDSRSRCTNAAILRLGKRKPHRLGLFREHERLIERGLTKSESAFRAARKIVSRSNEQSRNEHQTKRRSVCDPGGVRWLHW